MGSQGMLAGFRDSDKVVNWRKEVGREGLCDPLWMGWEREGRLQEVVCNRAADEIGAWIWISGIEKI